MPTNLETTEGVSRRASLLEQYGLVTPDHTIKLPSNGWLYPKYDDGRFIDAISVRGLTIKEMKWLPGGDAGSASLLNRLLAAIIIPPQEGWPQAMTTERVVRQLVDGDVPSVLLAMRICTFGLEFKAPMKCWSCEHVYTRDIDLATEVDIKHLTKQPDSDGNFSFSDNAVFNGAEVRFKLLTLEDEEAISNSIEERKKRGLATDNDASLERFAKAVLSIGSLKDKGDIKFLLGQMPLSMLDKFSEKLKEVDFGPYLDNIAVSCPKCGTKDTVSVPLALVVLSRQ